MQAKPFCSLGIHLAVLGRSNADAGAMKPALTPVAAHHKLLPYSLAADAPKP